MGHQITFLLNDRCYQVMHMEEGIPNPEHERAMEQSHHMVNATD
jgi:hypothetical protein